MRKPSTARKSRAVLCGVLKCGGCMSSMTPTHTTKAGGKMYRYYSPTHYIKGRCKACAIKRIAARDIENLVLSEMQAIFQAPEMILEVWRTAAKEDGGITASDIQTALADIAPVWGELFPKEQERLIQLMLETVVVYPDAVDMRFRAAGLANLVRSLDQHNARLEASDDDATRIAAE